MAFFSLTSVHVILSLVGILSGLFLCAGLIAGRHQPFNAALFLATTLATSLTGFVFTNATVTPAQVFGAISLVALAIAIVALYVFHARGGWRIAYVATAILAFYLNAFVGIVQAFQKLAPLQSLAPTQTEAPFAIAQALLFIAVVAVGIISAKRFRMSTS